MSQRLTCTHMHIDAIDYTCPSGSTCNPYTNYCDTSVTCAMDQITPVGATPGPAAAAGGSALNHATITSISHVHLVYAILLIIALHCGYNMMLQR